MLKFLILLTFIVDCTHAVGYVNFAKGEKCSDGICQDVCIFENIELAVGEVEVNDGKCRKIQCNHDFSVTIK